MYFPSPTINPLPSIDAVYDDPEFDATSKINLPSVELLETSNVCPNIAANLYKLFHFLLYYANNILVLTFFF